MSAVLEAAPAGGALAVLREIVARLRAPGGCPWDREQTHASLRANLVEEAYEVVEAIDRGNDAALREELGDLLLQVVMHSQIASEESRFDFDDTARVVSEKLIRRHPHVFGDTKVEGSDAVLSQWDKIKRQEKGETAAPASILQDAPGLPALMRAEKMQTRAARAGFDWDNLEGVFAKLREEIAEAEAAAGDSAGAGEGHRLEDEIGDLLFTVVNLARKAGVDAELALQASTGKFIRRFHQLETVLASRGRDFARADMAELDAIWDEVKRRPAAAGAAEPNP